MISDVLAFSLVLLWSSRIRSCRTRTRLQALTQETKRNRLEATLWPTPRQLGTSFHLFLSLTPFPLLVLFLSCVRFCTLLLFCLSGTSPVMSAGDTIVMDFVTNVVIVDGQAATEESTRQHAVVQNLRFAMSAGVRDAFRHSGVWHWRSRRRDVKRPLHLRRFRWDIARHSLPLRVFVFMLQSPFPLYPSAATHDHYFCIPFPSYLRFLPHRTPTHFKIFG